jgi:lysozyme
MTISENGVKFIKQFEGFIPNAYKDPGSSDGLPVTIGYGSTMYKDGSRIKLGDVLTEQQASDLLAWEVGNKSAVINSYKLKLTQNQFDALSSFVYNLGAGAFNYSTLLKKIKINPNDPTIKDEFMKWVKNDGKTMKGLVRRRDAEQKLYFTP